MTQAILVLLLKKVSYLCCHVEILQTMGALIVFKLVAFENLLFMLHLGDFVVFTFIMHELLNFKHFHYPTIKICKESRVFLESMKNPPLIWV